MTSLRPAAITEATTYLLLLSTLVWRASLDGPDVSRVIGPIHGLAFIWYLFAVSSARAKNGWSAWTTARVLVAAVIPVGGYVVAERVATAT